MASQPAGADAPNGSFVSYLRQHKVSKLIEEMLRELSVARPEDPERLLTELLLQKGGGSREERSPSRPSRRAVSLHENGAGLDLLRDAFDTDEASPPAAAPDAAAPGTAAPGPAAPDAAPDAAAAAAAATGVSTVLANLGPVIGKVTEHSAVVLLEVDTDCELTCVAVPAPEQLDAESKQQSVELSSDEPIAVGRRRSSIVEADVGVWATPREGEHPDAAKSTRRAHAGRPVVFLLEGLKAGVKYDVDFVGISAEQRRLFLRHGGCSVRTLPGNADRAGQLRVIALSCDRPNRLMGDEGETNPWDMVALHCVSGDCDVVLHCGDQVYTCMNDHLEWCYRYYELMEKAESEPMREKLREKSIERLRDAYRDTWTFPGVRRALAHSSHLMLWSDNDVANDFTVLKDPRDPSKQAYPPGLLRCAMEVYREYQRQLWDTNLAGLADPVEEWHFHMYGRVGIFMMDMRGSRIDAAGNQQPGKILTEAQKAALVSAFKTEQMSCMLLCSEIPYVGDDPTVIQEKAKKFVFLEDHWPYHLEELSWLLDLCFDWRHEREGREVVLIGGDIHVGVESTIKDKKTGAVIKSITTSPITNHVCGFFPALSGSVGDRYTYEHKVLKKKRNFVYIDIQWEDDGKCNVRVDLVAFHTLGSLEDERKKKGENEEHRHKGMQFVVGDDKKGGNSDFLAGFQMVGASREGGGGLRRRSSCPAIPVVSFMKKKKQWFGAAGKQEVDWFGMRQPVLDTREDPGSPQASPRSMPMRGSSKLSRKPSAHLIDEDKGVSRKASLSTTPPQ
eukprot:TRINITY_DN2213_c2_g1_i1.p1 TRINITY_DN2213_c2_g1~~TRINITY_DN2213_c2_g1_i1.p1  ORF type:complete len:803 (+),score=334.43 TRINITY_DN2213_c2_g1_i1:47-2410(+)